MKAKSTYSLKDDLFNSEKVAYLTNLIANAHPNFAAKKFQKEVLLKFPELELKQRMHHISDCLVKHLPDKFPEACSILVKSLPEKLDPSLSDDDFGEFIFASFSHFIVCQGCSKKHLNRSLKALSEITKRFSAEYAIRYFINEFPDETFEFLEACATDKNYHVRRLASEGTRPRLPWAQNLATTPEKTLPILHQLHADSTRYVTRSVANHLNDISKIDAQLVISTLKQWHKQKRQQPAELAYMTRHALRTLLKTAEPEALRLLGYAINPKVSITNFSVKSDTIKVGSLAELTIGVISGKKQQLLIDYVLQNPSGRSKVFKIKQLTANKDEEILLQKSHPFKLMTTRALALGTYQLILRINGKEIESLNIYLQ